MKPTPRWSIILLCLCLSAATSAAAMAQDAVSDAADQIAKKVAEATGDPTTLDKLAFSFVVEKGGEEVMRRRHVWKPKAGTLTVRAADETIELTQLHDHDLTKLAEHPEANAQTWKTIAPDSSPEKAAKAWAWFINDSYWLLAPAKLMDPGVNRSLDDEGRLVLTFGEVGLTPGDRYALTVDKNTWQVTRWDFELESGRKGAFRWTDYKEAGPLMVSTRRVSEGGDLVIRLADVEAKR